MVTGSRLSPPLWIEYRGKDPLPTERAAICAPLSNPTGIAFATKALAIWLGGHSYSLYLIHFQVLAFFGEVAVRRLPALGESRAERSGRRDDAQEPSP